MLPRSLESIERLLKKTRSYDSRERDEARRVLIAASDVTVPAIIEALTDRDKEIREAALDILTELGCTAIPHLLKASDSSCADLRRGAECALARIDALVSASIIDALPGTSTPSLQGIDPQARVLSSGSFQALNAEAPQRIQPHPGIEERIRVPCTDGRWEGQPASTLPTAPAASSDKQLGNTILGAFEGDINRVRVSLSYRVALLLVSVVMVLLPLIYVGLMVLAGYAVYYHVVNNEEILDVGGSAYVSALVFIAYLAPIVIGVILVAFMVKPLFAHSAQASCVRSLTRDRESLLFAFVDRICEAVRAPAPTQIDVNCEVNASARFRRGVLSFIGNDLVLTIGLPLVANLNLRQFAGVLAHELGHFSQGAGMRLSYVIRSIAFWFQRVVYERDEWDEWLDAIAQAVDLRVGWVFYLAQILVWLTRQILCLLMRVGHAVAGYLLRQMEFDADRYAARLAGSDSFESTVRRLKLLQVAAQKTHADVGRSYREGRLGDSLPMLIHANFSKMSKNLVQQIDQSIDESTTGLFDTHPSDRDRIANLRREETPGIFQFDKPATFLFLDFPDASRKVTRDYYRGIFGPQFEPQEIHPIEDLLRWRQEDQESHASLVRFFQGLYCESRPLRYPQMPAWDFEQEKMGERDLRQARGSMVEHLDQYRDLAIRRRKLLADLLETRQVLQLLRARIPLSPNEFSCPVSFTAAQKRLRSIEEQVCELDDQMVVWEELAAQRLNAAIGLLFCESFASRIQQVSSHRERCRRVIPVGRQLQAALPLFVELRFEFGELVALLRRLEKDGGRQIFVRELYKQMDKVLDRIRALREPFLDVVYPFDHAKANMTIDRFLLTDPLLDRGDKGAVYEAGEPDPLLVREDLGAIYKVGESVIDKFTMLVGRATSQLASSAEAVEDAVGLERLPDPPEDDSSELP